MRQIRDRLRFWSVSRVCRCDPSHCTYSTHGSTAAKRNPESDAREDLERGRIDWRALTSSPVGESVQSQLANKDAASRIEPYEIQLLRGDGGRVWTLVTEASLADAEQRTAAFVIDITKRKRAEHQLELLNRELERRVIDRTVQLEAANSDLESFSYSISHDLRSPLHVIDGYSRLLLERYSERLEANGNKFLGIVRSSVREMSQMIDDVLAFSRAGTKDLKMSHVNMTELFRTAFDDLSLEHSQRRIELNMTDLPVTRGDLAALRRVATNLLSNAFKFTGGFEHPCIRIDSVIGDHEVTFSVRDNGVGFDPTYKESCLHCFNACMERTNSKAQG
jgi:signal transduction histidine kinase